MCKKRYINKLLLVLLLPAAVIFSYSVSKYPGLVEKLYSTGTYRFIGRPLSQITGIFPFSLAEVIIILLTIYILYRIFYLIYRLIKVPHGKGKILKTFIINTSASISITYFSFIVLWGLNYHRKPFSQIINMPVSPPNVNELEGLCLDLIERANKLRSLVNENTEGVMKLSYNSVQAFNEAYKGYDEASIIYPVIGGKYGRPKGVFLSRLMSYAGISGVYFPFTGEANVNTNIPNSILPAAICHEMAHQRGFAREDEANYIAYLTSTMNPDVQFQYSGTLFALVYSMNALAQQDLKAFSRLKSMYSDGVRRDLLYINKFWGRYEGPIDRVTSKINNTYLKSNLQGEGIYSYNRMVNLLVAEYRLKVSDKK